MSSDSDAEELDLDDINDIRVDPADLDELDQLFATTKQDLSTFFNIFRYTKKIKFCCWRTNWRFLRLLHQKLFHKK